MKESSTWNSLEDEDVVIGKLIKVLDVDKQIFQCEGCES